MGQKKAKPSKLSELKPEEQLKYEIAKELGLFDKVMKTGWKSLSAKETGKIGGLITKEKNLLKKQALSEHNSEDCSPAVHSENEASPY